MSSAGDSSLTDGANAAHGGNESDGSAGAPSAAQVAAPRRAGAGLEDTDDEDDGTCISSCGFVLDRVQGAPTLPRFVNG